MVIILFHIAQGYRTPPQGTYIYYNITIAMDMPRLEAYDKYIIKPVRQNINLHGESEPDPRDVKCKGTKIHINVTPVT